jgi:hypothetical protein
MIPPPSPGKEPNIDVGIQQPCAPVMVKLAPGRTKLFEVVFVYRGSDIDVAPGPIADTMPVSDNSR